MENLKKKVRKKKESFRVSSYVCFTRRGFRRCWKPEAAFGQEPIFVSGGSDLERLREREREREILKARGESIYVSVCVDCGGVCGGHEVFYERNRVASKLSRGTSV